MFGSCDTRHIDTVNKHFVDKHFQTLRATAASHALFTGSETNAYLSTPSTATMASCASMGYVDGCR